MPPLLADFIRAKVCKPICEKFLTLPKIMAMNNNRMRILKKVMDAGFNSEKEIIAITTKEMVRFCRNIQEISEVLELQEAVKGNKLITYLSCNKADEENE